MARPSSQIQTYYGHLNIAKLSSSHEKGLSSVPVRPTARPRAIHQAPRGCRCRHVLVRASQLPSNDMADRRAAQVYTCGEPNQVTSVIINRGRMEVRRNCEYVLREARAFIKSYVDTSMPRNLLWCDAIFRNQESVSEKSHQSAAMDHIYKNAQRIQACVREGAEDSHFLTIIGKQIVYLLTSLSANTATQHKGMPRSPGQTTTTGFVLLKPVCRIGQD